jgi:hypothetical protein
MRTPARPSTHGASRGGDAAMMRRHWLCERRRPTGPRGVCRGPSDRPRTVLELRARENQPYEQTDCLPAVYEGGLG